MTDNEHELLNLIRNHDDPGTAFKIAMDIMIDFLAQREAPQDTSFGHPRVSA